MARPSSKRATHSIYCRPQVNVTHPPTPSAAGERGACLGGLAGRAQHAGERGTADATVCGRTVAASTGLGRCRRGGKSGCRQSLSQRRYHACSSSLGFSAEFPSCVRPLGLVLWWRQEQLQAGGPWPWAPSHGGGTAAGGHHHQHHQCQWLAVWGFGRAGEGMSWSWRCTSAHAHPCSSVRLSGPRACPTCMAF